MYGTSQIYPSESAVLRGHTFCAQLGERLLGLGEVSEIHPAQDMVCLGELDVGVGRDLDPVAPGIEEVEDAPIEYLDPYLFEGAPRQRLVVDCNAEMPVLVRPLISSLEKLMNWSPK